jgi:dipeptidyl aminopeptidase/acylaminoacyl peptidase
VLVELEAGNRIFDFEWVSPRRVIVLPEFPGSARVRSSASGDLFEAERDRIGLTLAFGKDEPPAEIVNTLKARDDDVVLLSVHPKRVPVRQLPYYTPAAPAKPTLIELDLPRRPASSFFSQNDGIGDSEVIPLVGARLLSDHQGQVRFAVGYDREMSLVVLSRSAAKAAWESSTLIGFRDNNISSQRFTADNRAVTFVAVRSGETLNALYRLDLASRAVEKLYQHTEADIAETVIDLQSGAVAGVLVHGERPQYHWLDERSQTAQLHRLLEQRFPGQWVRITSASEDGSKALLLVSSDTNPGDYYILDVPRRKADLLMAARESLDPAKLRAKQAVQIPARDGVILHGYVTQPSDSKGVFPLVVMPHDGLPGARDGFGFDAPVQMLANRGYAVLQVNFRGSGGHGADFEGAGHRQWGARMQDDITDATRWVIEQGIAAADRICIYGVGYGGYAALMGAVREPQLYRCAAGHSGIYDLELMIKADRFGDYRVGAARLDDRYFGTAKVPLRQKSPVHNADAIQAPVLLIHGKRDRRASPDQALRMKSALQRANKVHELLMLDHSGPDAEQEDRVAAYEKLLAFLERHLSAPPPSP